jgi:hypothetical protein
MPRPKRDLHPLTIRLTPESLAKLHEFCVVLSQESGVAMVSLSQGVSVLIDRLAGAKSPTGPKPRRWPPRTMSRVAKKAPKKRRRAR